ncbi:MAG: ComEC family competence protein, partial [Clostridia bacterium]|nr:ComEC family competence protein [Clostridia bacterium]
MRRPLTAVCLFLAVGIAISFYTDIRCRHLCILCMGACFVAEAGLRARRAEFSAGTRPGRQAEVSSQRGIRTRALAAACLLALLAGSLRMDAEEARTSGLFDGTNGETEALVTGAVWKGSYWQLTARAGGLGGEQFLVRLTAGEEDMETVCSLVGRQCGFAGSVREPDGRRNFGCFDYRLYLRGRGIFRILEVNRYRVRGGPLKQPLLNFLAVSKARFYGRVRPFLGEEDFSLLAGLLFGDKGFLDEDLYASFRSGGIAHVLAVSGLHVGLVYGALVKLLGNRRNARTTAIAAAALLCYAALSNFSVSVMRAAFMIGLRLASFHLHRRYDLVSAASLAALAFLSINPYQLLDAGFQLSYMAAYSLGVALPRLELKALELSDRYKKGWILKLSSVLSPCMAVQLGMTPLTVFHFLLFSPVSLVLNPFALALAGLLLPAGLLLYLVQMLDAPLLTAIAAGPADAFARLLIGVSRAGEGLGGSYAAAAPP